MNGGVMAIIMAIMAVIIAVTATIIGMVIVAVIDSAQLFRSTTPISNTPPSAHQTELDATFLLLVRTRQHVTLPHYPKAERHRHLIQ